MRWIILLALFQRYYWPTAISTMQSGKFVHTHVEVVGRVVYTRMQDDGDLHIKLANPADTTKWIIAECTPLLPCTRPTKGSLIRVRGISRLDPEHHWAEIHPVEYLWLAAP